MIKYTQEEIEKYLWNDFKYELIDKYKNVNTPVDIKTQEGYIVPIRINSLKLGYRIRTFGKSNPHTIYNIRLWCKLNNKPFKLCSKIYEDDHKNLKWKCLKDSCGEMFYANWGNIHSGEGCSYCFGRKVGLSNCLATKNPELVKEWHSTKNGDLTPYDITYRSSKRVWWKCNQRHEWETIVSSRSKKENGTGCPICSNKQVLKGYNDI